MNERPSACKTLLYPGFTLVKLDSDRNRTAFPFKSHAIICSAIQAHSFCMASIRSAPKSDRVGVQTHAI